MAFPTEISTHDASPPLRVPVNLVLVRVVVRDSRGKTIGNLKKEDFQILDSKKPVAITHFSADTPESLQARVIHAEPATGEPAAETAPAPKTAAPAGRFVAFLFDDTFLKFEDLTSSRAAADRYIASNSTPSDRFAIVTISGQHQLDFTDDHAKIHDALLQIMPHPISAADANDSSACPPVSFYQAYLAQVNSDPNAVNAAVDDAWQCAFKNQQFMRPAAEKLANAAIARAYQSGDVATTYALRRLEEMVRRLSAAPGQRNLIFVSGGFLFPAREGEFFDMLDRAARNNVVISSLDARGLYVMLPEGDLSNPEKGTAGTVNYHAILDHNEQAEQSNVLLDLADSTGGIYFQNNNDLDAGFKRLAGAPEYSYLLGFTPQKSANDGKFHNINVTVTTKEKYEIQARRGYFMPKRNADPAEALRQELNQALFSQEEVHDLPIDLRTQFFRVDANAAKLAVMTHVDVARLRFHKADGRNQNKLTMETALFDRNGNYVTGAAKVIDMKLRDETLASLGNKGVNVRTNFDVKPGTYVVRLVARDSEGLGMTAANGIVEIPQ